MRWFRASVEFDLLAMRKKQSPLQTIAGSLGRVDERAAAPAREPFPAWLHEIRCAVVPACVRHPLGTRRRFPIAWFVLFQAGAARALRFFSRIFGSHFVSSLAWTRVRARDRR